MRRLKATEGGGDGDGLDIGHAKDYFNQRLDDVLARLHSETHDVLIQRAHEILAKASSLDTAREIFGMLTAIKQAAS